MLISRGVVETMRAMGATGGGVQLFEIPKPMPGSGEVRVKVVASAVNEGEAKVVGGDFVGRFLHAKTAPLVLGWDVAGAVDALGRGVTDIDEGAGGGIGSVSIGIGKRLRGRVTGVCSTKDVERVQALGVDEVIDRRKSDPFDAESVYDVVFDTPAAYSFGRCAHLLRTRGAYVTTLPDAALLSGMTRALFTSKRCRFVQVASKRGDLELVGRWLSEGLEVPIDSRHRVADLGAALERQSDPHRVGRVVVDVAVGWPS